jgi:hypothetical protein
MSSGPNVIVSAEIMQRLAPLAQQMGIAADLPGLTRIAPTIDLGMPIRMLALELGQLLSRQLIFLHGGSVVTVDGETGEKEPMKVTTFCGDVEEFCAIRVSGKSQRTRESLSREDAAMILDQKIFKASLRELRAVHLMRLPVQRENGKIEFLEPGYDEESKIYTVERLSYEMDWDLEKAIDFLKTEWKDFPWGWPTEEHEDADLIENRNFAVHLFACLSSYCRGLFEPGVPRPMVTYIGNQVGTGKSLLAVMSQVPVFGQVAASTAPKDDERMEKVLETVARTLQPYLILDDVKYGLNSTPLNKFLTATAHNGRCMGNNNEMFMVPNVTQVLATGNGITITDDLTRRSLICELFAAGELKDRNFSHNLNPRYLARDEVRQQYLAAFCAIVKNYIAWLDIEEGTVLRDALQNVSFRPLPSFEEVSELIGAIVIAAGFANPLQPPDIAPNEETDELRELLVVIASGQDANRVYDRKEMVTLARENSLLESLVGSKDDAELDAKTAKRWGRQLQRWRGRELIDQRGRRFRFGHRRQKAGATYPLEFLSKTA